MLSGAAAIAGKAINTAHAIHFIETLLLATSLRNLLRWIPLHGECAACVERLQIELSR